MYFTKMKKKNLQIGNGTISNHQLTDKLCRVERLAQRFLIFVTA